MVDRSRQLRVVDDAGVVALASRGSQIAWDELVRRFGGLLAAVARSHRLGPADAADIAQATWLKLYRHIGDLREPQRVAAWLATTARRECLRLVTSRREHPVDPVSTDA